MVRELTLLTAAALFISGCATTGSNQDISPQASPNVEKALARIEANNKQGAQINAVITTTDSAVTNAFAADAVLSAGKKVRPLEGIPVVIKDNIETDDAPTTAGSLALKGNKTGRDAPLVKRLRDAGAIIIGKTNLSEWANIRSTQSTSGWSAVGGLTRNPHSKAGQMLNSCGSSSGSGAAVAAGFVDAAIGTETDGSIVCPSGSNGIVGMKPTLGLVSRTHIVPIASSQDSAGPMAADVMMAARLLAILAGTDPADAATAEADVKKADYPLILQTDTKGLQGMRIGVLRAKQGDNKEVIALFNSALDRMKNAGAILVDIEKLEIDEEKLGGYEFGALLYELKHDIADYLQSLPVDSPVKVRTLADIMAFNKAHTSDEMQYFGQDIFEMAEAGSLICPAEKKNCDIDAEYRRMLSEAKRMAGKDGIDRLLAQHGVDLLVQPTNGPVWESTLGKGDNMAGSAPFSGRLPAVSGYPHLTVPMGVTAEGRPIGLSFMGTKWADELLLRAGYAFERAGPPLKVTPTLTAP